MPMPFALRAAQIDLNRQYEPMSFIREYFAFLAENSYNTVLLYLGWRVTLDSHPWRAPGGSYDRDDIRAIVACAHENGLQVIPTTDLTFANSLTRYPELKELMETGTRFWGSRRGNFCLSNPKTWDFIENYLAELAELVPSDYFHVGGDEAWDLGFCERCTRDGFDFTRECAMYRDFIVRLHSFVTAKLKRRMIMWDDMFEFYPDVLPEIPRDVVMAHWQYDSDVLVSRGHFGNRKRERTPDKYDELGFDYVLAAATRTSANGRTFTEYVQNGKRLLGGFMTTWVSHLRFMYKALPAMASVGRLWAYGGDEETHFRRAMTEILGNDDAQLLAAVRCYCESNMARFSNYTPGAMATHGFNGPDYADQAKRQLALSVLRDREKLVTGELGRKIVAEILLSLDLECALFDWKLEFRRVIEGTSDPAKFAAGAAEVRRTGEAYAAKWDEWRPGIEPNHLADWLNKFLTGAEALAKEFRSGNFLRILFASPNAFGAVQVTVTALANGGETVLGKAGFRGDQTFFERFFPLADGVRPDAVRIAVKGYGGQGVAHVAMRLDGRDLAPCGVTGEGLVRDAEAILDDDCKFAFLGDQDTLKSWHDRAFAEKTSSVTVRFAPSGRR